MRYADAHLMKAEAHLWKGEAGMALTMVNDLRNARGASPLGSINADEMLAERGREMYMEWIRRTDLVRFGQYTRDWEFKEPSAVGDETKNIYPIPSAAILSNPNLIQNAGY